MDTLPAKPPISHEPPNEPIADRPHEPHEKERSTLRRPPVTRRGLVAWLLAYVVMTGVAIAVGFLIVDHLGGVRSLDPRVRVVR